MPVLATLLRTALALLHPFMPFVTEELWQRLPHDGEFIGQGVWPSMLPERRDPQAAADMERVLGFVETARALRAHRAPTTWTSVSVCSRRRAGPRRIAWRFRSR